MLSDDAVQYFSTSRIETTKTEADTPAPKVLCQLNLNRGTYRATTTTTARGNVFDVLKQARQDCNAKFNYLLDDGCSSATGESMKRKWDVDKGAAGAVDTLEPSRPTLPGRCVHDVKCAELECFISASHWSHRPLHSEKIIQEYVKEGARVSADARSTLPCALDVQYAAAFRTRIDLFGFDALPGSSPIVVFVHGGLWSEGSRQMSAFLANSCVRAGVPLAVVGYDLAPKADLNEIVSEIVAAIDYMTTLATQRGAPPIVLCGHSSGAHLVAAATLVRAHRRSASPLSLILLSGIFDVRPVLHMPDLQKSLRLTPSLAQTHSPLLNPQALLTAVQSILIVVTRHDSPLYRVQSSSMYEALRKTQEGNDALNCKTVVFEELRDDDHFTMVQNLVKFDHPFTKRIIQFVKQGF